SEIICKPAATTPRRSWRRSPGCRILRRNFPVAWASRPSVFIAIARARCPSHESAPYLSKSIYALKHRRRRELLQRQQLLGLDFEPAHFAGQQGHHLSADRRTRIEAVDEDADVTHQRFRRDRQP